ncbi:MAG: enoyl-CoA hydratase/isomerase family protein [Acidimicrobiia bacterium]
MGYQEYETLIVERRGHVGWLIFNRPDALNARNLKMIEELSYAWVDLDEDPEVRVIVNIGRGRAFQTGADVKEIAAAGGMANRIANRKIREGGGLTARENDVAKPVICAINGLCAGGGLNFVGDADIVVASSAATFVDTHVSVGQVSGIEPVQLVNRLPFGAIMRLVLMGRHERLNAETAKELGLVSQIFQAETFEEDVQKLAETVARNSPTAMMLSKWALWKALEVGRAEAIALGHEAVKDMWDHTDNAEGAKAFSEKREANWAPGRRPRL